MKRLVKTAVASATIAALALGFTAPANANAAVAKANGGCLRCPI
jgi:hypothetical protein